MTPLELKNAIPEFRDGNIYLTDNGVEHCIMYGEEEEYIKESIYLIYDRIKPSTVVELGFGLGFTAQAWQDKGVDLHIIFEPNLVLYNRALEWAEGKSGVFIINSRYQDYQLNFKADLVYNDIYEMCNDNYAMGGFDEVKKYLNFNWYAEFCVDYPGDEYKISDEFFRFQFGKYDKIQLLKQNG